MDILSTAASYSVYDIEVIHMCILIAVPSAANHVSPRHKADRDVDLDNGVTALTKTDRVRGILTLT